MATVLVTMLVLGVFIPIVQATTGAANEVRGRVLLDVYLKTDATPTDVDARARALLDDDAATSRRVEFVSKAAGLRRSSSSATPRPTSCSARNPLPDTFRVTPDDPDKIATIRDALAPRPPSGERALADPAIDEVRNRQDDTNKILSATRVVKLTMALLAGAARARLDAADRQHDPALAVRAPARGRGDEARRRDRLVHPLAVRASRA